MTNKMSRSRLTTAGIAALAGGSSTCASTCSLLPPHPATHKAITTAYFMASFITQLLRDRLQQIAPPSSGTFANRWRPGLVCVEPRTLGRRYPELAVAAEPAVVDAAARPIRPRPLAVARVADAGRDDARREQDLADVRRRFGDRGESFA